MVKARHLIEMLGLLAIVVGCWEIYAPLAWIVGGVVLLVIAFCWWALES